MPGVNSSLACSAFQRLHHVDELDVHCVETGHVSQLC